METIGSLTDKITIANLKMFHMEEQVERKSGNKDHVRNCSERLRVLREQKNDLIAEINQYLREMKAGKRKNRVYRQFKMYNNPEYNLLNKT